MKRYDNNFLAWYLFQTLISSIAFAFASIDPNFVGMERTEGIICLSIAFFCFFLILGREFYLQDLKDEKKARRNAKKSKERTFRNGKLSKPA